MLSPWLGAVSWIQDGRRWNWRVSALAQLSGLAWLGNASLHGNGVRVELNMPLLTFGIFLGAEDKVLILEGEKKRTFFRQRYRSRELAQDAE